MKVRDGMEGITEKQEPKASMEREMIIDHHHLIKNSKLKAIQNLMKCSLALQIRSKMLFRINMLIGSTRYLVSITMNS